jgi:gamma-glutamylcyclotransferase (GGCT)/AIG2-like uncharacterized protein YtfP
MNLFAYGTLMDSEIMEDVCGEACRSQRATLLHYVRKRVCGEVYPAIAAQPGGAVAGVVYFDLSSAAMSRLDRFEGDLYQREVAVVICDHGESIDTHTYVISTGCVHKLSDDDWSYEDFMAKHKQLFQNGYCGYAELE